MPSPRNRPLELALAPLLLLLGCPPTPSAEPPDEGPPPALAISAPAQGAAIVTAPDAERSVAITFAAENVRLKAPGTCLASDGPCGHVVVTVDGDACNGEGSAFNSIATAPPARANLARCADPTGAHTVTLSLARDDRAPWMVDDAPVTASVQVTTQLPPLIDRLGGEDTLRALAGRVIEGQLSRGSINAYFRNASVDHEHMESCMGSMFIAIAQGTKAGDGDGDPCEADMQVAHQGLGISAADFDDWMEVFEEAAASLGIVPEDLEEVRARLMQTGEQMIEDPTNDATLYQRLGRRPGIWTVIETFANKLGMHAEVSRYFLNDDGLPEYSEAFSVCLLRLLGGMDGPFIYGEEFPLEPALAAEGRNCRGMVESHDGVTSAAPESRPIGPDEFLEVAFILVDSLLYHEVPQEDIDLIVQAMNLPALCTQIVANPEDCDGLF